MQFWCSFDAVLMQFWCSFENYIKTASIWCSFDAVLMQFWCSFENCIKTASKLHQKCIRFFPQFCFGTVFLSWNLAVSLMSLAEYLHVRIDVSSIIHKLQFSFEERHGFFQERVSLQNGKHMRHSFLGNVAVLPVIANKMKPAFNHTVCLSKIQVPTQHAVCVIDILYCCQKVAVINARWKIVWKKKVTICLIFP